MSFHASIGHLLRESFRLPTDFGLPTKLQSLLDRLAEPSGSSCTAIADHEFKQRLSAATPALRGYARRLCRDATLADDLVQDTMLKAWRARHRFIVDSNFKSWIYTILRNGFLSHLRRQRRAAAYDRSAAEVLMSVDANQDRRLNLADVDRALARLPDAQREAVYLVGAEELTYEQAADVTAVPLGTVKSRVARGRALLVKLVEGETLA